MSVANKPYKQDMKCCTKIYHKHAYKFCRKSSFISKIQLHCGRNFWCCIVIYDSSRFDTVEIIQFWIIK